MIQMQALRVQRGDKQLITSLTMQAKKGEVVVVLGPNGAGKSTLLLALTGLHADYAGEIILQDKTLPHYSHQEISLQVAWQGELPPTEFGLTVQQRLEMACSGKLEKLAQALAYFELKPLAKRALGELSSGERQRVEIAAIMVRDCPIWLMDEPTAHLDMRHQVDCLKLMKQEAEQGRLIITVLHDLPQAAAIADRVVVLDGLGGVEVGLAKDMLTAKCLEPIFHVKLKGNGYDLMPAYQKEYHGELYEKA
ncbi:MAG: ABC transporter ATP-binding protein [Mariprofundaceae bacterium]|nr:ABC transporter ATP-binding protein [Mariprofundaceae bacterium]